MSGFLLAFTGMEQPIRSAEGKGRWRVETHQATRLRPPRSRSLWQCSNAGGPANIWQQILRVRHTDLRRRVYFELFALALATHSTTFLLLADNASRQHSNADWFLHPDIAWVSHS